MNSIFNLFKKVFKNSHETNMETEIYSQPEIIEKLISKYINSDNTINIDLPDGIEKIALIASGSSYHSATIAANYFRNNAHIYSQSYYASEFSLNDNIDIDLKTLYIFISQSGETADTNKALDIVRIKTDKTLCITNTKNSKMYTNSKYRVLIHAGVEKSIASTKAMCAQIYCLFLIAVKFMYLKQICTNTLIDELKSIPKVINGVFDDRASIKYFADKLVKYDNAAVLASGMFYPLAKEGALKIKETSYINTTGYPTGEFLHGHIAILNKRCAVITIVNNSNVEFTVKVLDKIRADYNADCLIISAFQIKVRNQENIIAVNAYRDVEFLFATLSTFLFSIIADS